MDFEGLTFLSLLLVASLLLADAKLRLRWRTKVQVWGLRPGRHLRRRQLRAGLLVLFCFLGGWLVYSHGQMDPLARGAHSHFTGRPVLLQAERWHR